LDILAFSNFIGLGLADKEDLDVSLSMWRVNI